MQLQVVNLSHFVMAKVVYCRKEKNNTKSSTTLYRLI